MREALRLDRRQLGREHPAQPVANQRQLAELERVQQVEVEVNRVVDVVQLVAAGGSAIARMGGRQHMAVLRERVVENAPDRTGFAVQPQHVRSAA